MTDFISRSKPYSTPNLLSKLLTLIFLLECFATGFSQQHDTRAVLNIDGGIKELSVSTNNQLWLTSARGQMYHSPGTMNNWSYEKEVAPDARSFIKPTLERITFFNADTAIMTGYIQSNAETRESSGYYLTCNGGKSWELKDFGKDEWIYDVFVDPTGKAWMGGSDGNILYSKDFGQSWKTRRSPFNSSTRMNSIYMVNANVGIAGALENKLYSTKNNWSSSKKIDTPFDQGMYQKSGTGYTDHRIHKVRSWKNHWVVKQLNHIYYTSKDKIEWKAFDQELHDFDVDPETGELFALTHKGYFVRIASNGTFYQLHNSPKKFLSKDFKVRKGKIFGLDMSNGVFELSENSFSHSIPYTVAHKIRKPMVVKEGADSFYGVSDRHLYRSDDAEKGWHRIAFLDRPVLDFFFESDTGLVLWNSQGENHYFDLNCQQLSPYRHKEPFKEFLQHPIEVFEITSGSAGCYHRLENRVRYSPFEDKQLITMNVQEIEGGEEDSKSWRNVIESEALLTILQSISASPYAFPQIQEFNITEEEKQSFRELITQRKEQIKDQDSPEIALLDTAIVDRIDSLSSSDLKQLLHQNEGIAMNLSAWFKMAIVNSNGDRLEFTNEQFQFSPWHLPWQVELNGKHFYCYNLGLSQFIKTCIPPSFEGASAFDNSSLFEEVLYLRPGL